MSCLGAGGDGWMREWCFTVHPDHVDAENPDRENL